MKGQIFDELKRIATQKPSINFLLYTENRHLVFSTGGTSDFRLACELVRVKGDVKTAMAIKDIKNSTMDVEPLTFHDKYVKILESIRDEVNKHCDSCRKTFELYQEEISKCPIYTRDNYIAKLNELKANTFCEKVILPENEVVYEQDYFDRVYQMAQLFNEGSDEPFIFGCRHFDEGDEDYRVTVKFQESEKLEGGGYILKLLGYIKK